MQESRNLATSLKRQNFNKRGFGFGARPSADQERRRQLETQRREQAEKKLINAESLLGRTVFGEIAPGCHREFFCLKSNVWIWYENGITMRYEVRPDGVYKRVDRDQYLRVEGQELQHFRAATKAYLELIKTHLYH